MLVFVLVFVCCCLMCVVGWCCVLLFVNCFLCCRVFIAFVVYSYLGFVVCSHVLVVVGWLSL